MRRIWLLAGLGMLGFGVWTLLAGDTNGTRPASTATWAAAALLAHDGLLAPVVFAAGWLLRRMLPERVRAAAVSALMLVGVAVLLLLPRWESPAARQNGTVNQPPSLADALLAVAVGLAALGVAHLLATLFTARATRARRSPGRPDADATG